MKLFIVESPSKCGYIKKYLGSDYNVIASVGHVTELPRRGLNIDVKDGFKPTYQISNDRKDVVRKIKAAAKKSDEIILATDPDREGEAIANSIYELLTKADQAKCVRITFDSVTKKAVLAAMKKKREINHDLVDAAKARQVLDRLIGYKVSPELWFNVASGTSAGRVQSIALKFVCERHKEIVAFVPEDFWFVDALLKGKNEEFWARVVTKNKENRFVKGALATSTFEELKEAKFKVDKVEKKRQKKSPFPPFDTASLNATCSSILGWNLGRSKKVSQSLYTTGKITYIRTDSYNISDDAMTEVRGLIKKASAKHLPDSPRKYHKKSGAAAQEAHECIRPTDVYYKGDDLSSEEQKMYKLIRDRFIASQMKDMLVDLVSYHIKTDKKHKLLAKGQSIAFDGWHKVYKYSKTKEEILPVVSEGEGLNLKDTKKDKHTTKPPPRFKEGSLLTKMEKEGVGRPSTWPSIIKAIQDKGYVEHEKGSNSGFVAKDLGMKVFDYLNPNFKDFFMDVKFTSQLEDEIHSVARGEQTFLELVQKTYDILVAELKRLKAEGKAKGESKFESTGEKCPKCKKGEILKKFGKYGEFYACEDYKNCKTVCVQQEDGTFQAKQKKVVKKVGRKCPDCEKAKRKGELLYRENKKSGSKFIGCNGYPTCKYTESVEEDVKD